MISYKKSYSLNLLSDSIKFKYLPLDFSPIYTKKNCIMYLKKLFSVFCDEIMILKAGQSPDYNNLIEMLKSMQIVCGFQPDSYKKIYQK